jgi:H+/Cl- antiporter ClcA
MRPRASLAFLTNRRLRERWQMRAVLWATAGAAGLAVVGFATLAEQALALLERIRMLAWWSPFLLAPGLGMFVVWATQRYVPGAAGIAATFNTPLAGIVFAVEELGRRLESRTSGVLVSTIIISGLVAIALRGNCAASHAADAAVARTRNQRAQKSRCMHRLFRSAKPQRAGRCALRFSSDGC